MQYLGKTKIGRFASKPNVIYPQMRLPQYCRETIGETADIYEVAHLGKKAFLFVLEGQELTDIVGLESQVLQPDEKVLQLSTEISIEDRLYKLESLIQELRSFIFEGASFPYADIKNKAPESGFEPESEPRQGSMIGRYTTRACAKTVVAQSTAY